jgi:F-box protein 18 (helicase)
VFIGDPHQHIYGFRGAINILEELEGTTHTYSLTQSFRFGPEIASVATILLAQLKKVKTMINGCSLPSTIYGNAVGQVAVIARTNLELFNKAIEVCLQESSMTRIAFVGGINGYGLDLVEDIYKLFSGNKRAIYKNKFISRFSSFATLKQYAQHSDDPELMGKIKLVEQHHNNIPSRIAALRSKCYNDSDLAEIVFSTAHKAKGLEFETVRILDDFIVNGMVTETEIGYHGWTIVVRDEDGFVPVDEKNLLYVAATRAKKALLMSRTLVNVLKKAGEQFLQVGPLPETEGHFTCESCKQKYVYSAESLVKVEQQQIILSTGSVFQARGLLCSNCSIRIAPCWKGLCTVAHPCHQYCEII